MQRAMALHASCWTEDPIPDRPKRIDDALEQIGELVQQAKASRDGDVRAVAEYASSLLRLRDSLAAR